MVQNGSIWVKNYTKYEYGQNSPRQSWENDLICEYIQIFWTNIFICKNIRWFFVGWIYSDIHSWSFYHAKYILIFICPISMVTNIFGYSFVQKKKDIHPTLSCSFFSFLTNITTMSSLTKTFWTNQNIGQLMNLLNERKLFNFKIFFYIN